VQLLDLSGGEPAAITDLPGGASGFAWAPDGKSLAVVATGEEAPANRDARRFTTIHYKNDGLGLLKEQHARLWLVCEDGAAAPRQLTATDQEDSNPIFSPDGKTIAFNRSRPSAHGSAPFNDVWTIDLASGKETNLTDGRGPCFGPTFAPDGATIAFVGHTEPNDIWWGKNFGVWTMPVTGGAPLDATSEFPHIAARAVFGDPWRGIPWPAAHWTQDGRILVFVATVGGSVHLFAADLIDRTEPRQLTSGRIVVTDFALAGDQVIFGAMDSDHPTDLWRVALSGGAPVQLTHLNDELIAEQAVGPAELIRFESFDGQATEAWLLAPAGFDPNGKQTYPLVLSIHGGPHGAYGEAFHHAFRVFAAAGYFVLYVNPRGSQGYGEAFAKQVIGDWGGGDFRDMMTAVERVLARGRVDARRLYAWGASYGGFMTSWIAGQTDRFAAICSVVPVTDLLSFYGTSDIGHYFGPYEMGAQPWEDRARYERMSPITYAANVTSPLLLVHHEEDQRVPISQSEQFFVTLKAMGKEVEFLRIAEASHGIVPPARAHAEVIGLEAALDWFARH
jgi:dipeptidyl aminopeptidase/acylaminoacyl peptidase